MSTDETQVEETEVNEDAPNAGEVSLTVDEDVESVIVGPPGYASPDEQTSAGRLVSLDQHPNRDEINPEYGAEVTAESLPNVTDAGEEVVAETENGENGDELDSMTKAELVAVADERGVDSEGMNKADLLATLKEG